MNAIILAVILLSSLFSMNVEAKSSPKLQTAQVSVVLAIDTSKSMSGSPMRKAKEAAASFVEEMSPGTAVAIVTFSSSAEVVQPYTTDRAGLLSVIDGLYADGVTALYDGSTLAVKTAMEAQTPQRYVILLSDGAEYGNQSSASREDALLLAQAENIPVYTVGLGFGTDRTFLQELANGTHALAFEAPTPDDLLAIYTGLQQQFASVATITPTTRSNGGIVLTSYQESPSVQPVIPNSTSTLQTPGQVSVVLVIDTSKSMSGSPMRKAREAAASFVEQMSPGTAVAIVTFSNTAQVIQPYTTDKATLLSVIEGLYADGVTALYDGSYLGVQTAGEAEVGQRYVILLSDGAEYGNQSAASRGDALLLAQEENIPVYTVGLGFGTDRTFLDELATGTHADFFEAPHPDELLAIYENLWGQIAAAEPATVTTYAGIPPMDAVTTPSGTALMSDSIAELEIDGVETDVESIPPISNSISVLNIPEGATETESALPETTDTVESPEVEVAPIVETPGELKSSTEPIIITIEDDIEVRSAELAINGVVLATYTDAESSFEYILDKSLLSAGDYQLTFTVVAENDVVSAGSLPFEVVEEEAPQPLPRSLVDADIIDEGEASETMELSTSSPLLGPGLRDSVASSDPASMIILIDGVAQPFNLAFTAKDGLTLKAPETAASVTPQNVGDIMAIVPNQIIPEPVMDVLTADHQKAAVIVILIMVGILMPQGMFTLYWMTYTWNNPKIAEKYRSPKEFLEPQYSFTAILPARREEDVIKHTIKSVDAIHYPDHLKEILIMIRDEDDDGTIQQAREAIAELGKDNIRLITFNEGPRNKPNGLNRGLKAAKNQVVCIFDAEDDPHPELYNVVNTVMLRDDADIVQSGVQLMNFESNWFSAFNVLEYFFWFKSGLHAFTEKFKVTPLGGNTVFIKKHWMEKIGGWDESCLTEDADIGIRLTLAGAKMQIVYEAEHATQEETPHNAENFIKQRTRWCQGFYQIFLKGDWRKLPTLKQKLTAIYILLNSLLQAAVLVYLPIGVYIALTQRVAVPIAIISWIPLYLLLLQLVVSLVGIREFASAYSKKLPLFFTLKMIVFYYPYQLMLSAAALRAAYRLVKGSSAWEKTAHSNLHRQTVVPGRA